MLEQAVGAPVGWFAYPYGVDPLRPGGGGEHAGAWRGATAPLGAAPPAPWFPGVDVIARPSRILRWALEGGDCYLLLRRTGGRLRRVFAATSIQSAPPEDHEATLLLVDLRTLLTAPGLEPTAGELVDPAAALLRGCRAMSVPVVHVWADDRPRGRRSHAALAPRRQVGLRGGDRGSRAARRPQLRRRAGGREDLVQRVFQPGARRTARAAWDRGPGRLRRPPDGCVRSTVLDAYQRGYRVWVPDDAVGSYDGLHAALPAAISRVGRRGSPASRPCSTAFATPAGLPTLRPRMACVRPSQRPGERAAHGVPGGAWPRRSS